MKTCPSCGNSDPGAFEPFTVREGLTLRSGQRCLKCSRVVLK